MAELDEPGLLEVQNEIGQVGMLACAAAVNQYSPYRPNTNPPIALIEFDRYDDLYPGIIHNADFVDHAWSDVSYNTEIETGNEHVHVIKLEASGTYLVESGILINDGALEINANITVTDVYLQVSGPPKIYEITGTIDDSFTGDELTGGTLSIDSGDNEGRYDIVGNSPTPPMTIQIDISTNNTLTEGTCSVPSTFHKAGTGARSSGYAQEADFYLEWNSTTSASGSAIETNYAAVPAGQNYLDVLFHNTGENDDTPSATMTIDRTVRFFYLPDPASSSFDIFWYDIGGADHIGIADVDLSHYNFNGNLNEVLYNVKWYIVSDTSSAPDPTQDDGGTPGVVRYSELWPVTQNDEFLDFGEADDFPTGDHVCYMYYRYDTTGYATLSIWQVHMSDVFNKNNLPEWY